MVMMCLGAAAHFRVPFGDGLERELGILDMLV
jgi:hypothetical protein